MASAMLLSRACLESSLRIPGKTKVLDGRGAYKLWTPAGGTTETRGAGVGTARLWSPKMGPEEGPFDGHLQILC